MRLILASGSPRRREILARLGVEAAVRPVDLDETPLPAEQPEVYVERLAREKAEARAEACELVLAADTTVAVDGEILGKPRDRGDAERMLALLAGREHLVATGVALAEPGLGRTVSAVEKTRVRFTPMSPEEISWYAATGEPMDKAGAYGIQGLGSLFVASIEGNYTNVVGLPVTAMAALFRELGHDLRDFRRLT